MDINPLLSSVDVISHPVDCFFILLISFTMQSFLSFDVVPFIYFCFCCLCPRIHMQINILPKPESAYCLCFLGGVLSLIFKSLIHIAFFLYMVWESNPVSFFSCSYSIFPVLFFEETVFSLCVFSPSLSCRSIDHKHVGLFLSFVFCHWSMCLFFVSTILFLLL